MNFTCKIVFGQVFGLGMAVGRKSLVLDDQQEFWNREYKVYLGPWMLVGNFQSFRKYFK
jgi:hypothetical protein